MKNNFFIFSIAIALLTNSNLVLAHGEAHDKDKTKNNIIPDQVLQEINQNYLKNVKPIFQAKCFDCHSTKTNYPWYYSIPGIKQLIDSDIEEGLEHLDLTNDFPFKGHAAPEEDMEELAEVLDEDSMPLLSYRIMHWDSKLTEKDKTVIREWIRASLEKIEKTLPTTQ